MKILIASSEVLPYSKTGGLADMVGALGKFLARAGHEVAMVTPLYRGLRESLEGLRPTEWKFEVRLGGTSVDGNVWVLEPAAGLKIFFVEQNGFYDRAGIYNEGGTDYPDNAERFVFFSKSVVHLARHFWNPDIIHSHDWQTGLVPLLVSDQKKRDGWSKTTKTVFTIHNLAYQGNFGADKFGLTNLPWDYFRAEGVEFYGSVSFLKAGLLYSDQITTVSPRYAREILTEELGCGLDGVLRDRQDALVGILNGVDYEEWKTLGNPYLKYSYSIDDMNGKAANKALLQRECGLPEEPGTPLFGTVSRLAEQKGIDIELGALQEMLAGNMQFVLLGSGQLDYERGYRRLAERYPNKCSIRLGFDTGLSHRLEAGCDFYLMPSRYEPCGLNQMYSLRYGTPPIVRTTGGLDDSVIDISENLDQADGIKFSEYSARALSWAVRKAQTLHSNKALLVHYQRNGMAKDFSWERTAASFGGLYRQVLGGQGKRLSAVASAKAEK